MSMPFDIKEELLVWAQQYGDETLSKQEGLYFKIDYRRGKRARLLIILLESLKNLGADKSYFKSGSFKDALIKQCLGPKHIIGKAKYSNGIDCITKELNAAIITVYGTESAHYKEHGKTRELKEEQSELEIDAEIERANREDVVVAQPVAQEEKEQPFTKIFDPKRETGEPTVIDNPDPELDDFLGFKK